MLCPIWGFRLRGDADHVAIASINVTNTGTLAGDEVVFLYHNGTAAARTYGTFRPQLPPF